MKLLAYCITAAAYAVTTTLLATSIRDGNGGAALLAALAVIGSIAAVIALWTAKP